jgi:hypothetical protein
MKRDQGTGSMQQVQDFKDLHSGKRVFILASGPSIVASQRVVYEEMPGRSVRA